MSNIAAKLETTNSAPEFVDRDTFRRSMSLRYKDMLRISDNKQLGYKKIVVGRSMDNVCGYFEITVDRGFYDRSVAFPGQVVNIELDNRQIMRGRIYRVVSLGDASSGDIVISGRDVTGDLVDSTVPEGAKIFASGVDILTIGRGVINGLGLGFLIGAYLQGQNTIEPFSGEDVISDITAVSAIDFLHRYCRKRQLILNTDIFGNLLFKKAEGTRSNNEIINKFRGTNNNVISYRGTYDISKRYRKYICRSQDAELWSSEEVDSSGTALDTDPLLYEGRELEFRMEEGADGSEALKRAEEESNLRRSRAFTYTAIVEGFEDKTLWAIDRVVKVVDDFIFAQGDFLIKAVEYRWDLREGKTTKLELTTVDAYTAQANIDKIKSKYSNQGLEWLGSDASASEQLEALYMKLKGEL